MEANENQIKEIEISADQARTYLKFADDTKAFTETELFKTVMVEGYFKNETIRLTGLLADANPETTDYIHKSLHAISSSQEFFRNVATTAQIMYKELKDSEEYLRTINEAEAK